MFRPLMMFFYLALILEMPLFQPTQNKFYTIRGRVIDANGAPISGALVYYSKEIGEYTGGPHEGVISDESGRFNLPVDGMMKSKTLCLFVTSGLPAKAMILMSPPFSQIPNNVRENFVALRLVLADKKEVDIGDIMPKVRFFSLALYILDEASHPKLVTAKQWSDVVIRLVGKDGVPVAATGMAQHIYIDSVNKEESTINVAVPEGSWRVEVSITDFEGPFWGTSILIPQSLNNSQRAIIKIVDRKE